MQLIISSKMDSKTINRFPIREYLAGLNIYPAKDRGYYGMYHSPFREDNDASMKVDYNKNLWIDYGPNEGGTLIDLVMRIDNVPFNEAITSLSQYISTSIRQPNSFFLHGNNIPSRKKAEYEPTIRVAGIAPLSNPSLMDYIGGRGINIEIAKFHCKEIYYSVNGKSYFAVGFRNDSNGYELRNKYFKGCTSKDVTSHRFGQDSCQIFEGFMDYLSFLTMNGWQRSPLAVIVLNSLANLPKIKNTLDGYRSVTLFLDNDEAGKRAVQKLRSVHNGIIDQSVLYATHKDLNDYLCSRSVPKQAVKKKPGRGLKM